MRGVLSVVCRRFIMATVAAKVVATGTILQKSPLPVEANHPGCDIWRQPTWTLDNGATGQGFHCFRFEHTGLQFKMKAFTYKDPATDNSIKVRMDAWDRCNAGENFVQIGTTNWHVAYSGASVVDTGWYWGVYQDCGQQANHEYFTQSTHWFTNNNPPLDQKKYISVFF